ncbi:MAG: ATP-binding protein [Acidobacteria bacterium]|nr:ATP-binding protein [Acidobacteriota bacterium]
MTQEEILELVRQEESQTHERKRSLSLQREGFESLCGMVNADPAQGTLVFGVAPDSQLVGVEPGDLDKAQRSLSQTISANFEPRLQFEVQVAELQGKRVVLVSAQRNRDVPYHEYDGRAYIREGTVTRQLSFTEKKSLERRRNRDLHTGPWKCNKCGSWVGNLVSVRITDQGMQKSYACSCGGEYWPAN